MILVQAESHKKSYLFNTIFMSFWFTYMDFFMLKKKKERKNAGDFKCTRPPALYSKQPQHTFQVFADHCGPK